MTVIKLFRVKEVSNKRSLANKLKNVLKQHILKRLPKRTHKIYFTKIFFGLKPINMLKIALFDNQYKYNHILVEKNTAFYFNYYYHLVSIIGNVIVSCISSGKVIGLCKLNLFVDCNAARLQPLKRLINQITNKLQTILSTEDATVNSDANKPYISSVSIRDGTMVTVTSFLRTV